MRLVFASSTTTVSVFCANVARVVNRTTLRVKIFFIAIFVFGNFSKDEKAFELAEKWKDKLDQVKEKITTKLIIRISQYAKEHSKEFIFGLLNESDFKDVDFTPQTRLTKFQYNQISSKTAVYNKQLKRLQKTFEMDITFTSHLPRHTYTNLLIESTDRDIYVISKSLGHRRLSATEHYVDDFNKERIDKGVGGFTKQFNLR